jgi:U2 small nuclear ribonucleoprotein A'
MTTHASSFSSRLTPDAILRAPQFLNCVGEYQLDMRDAGIQIIENLGATENQFESVDLSNNAIATLDGFPKLSKLRSLYVNNNRISRLSESLGTSLPNLEWLVLTNNRVAKFAELDKCLAGLTRLKYLSLMDNPVAMKRVSEYRLFVISRCPGLKMLDYKKVTAAEREAVEAGGWAAKDASEFDRMSGLGGGKRKKEEEEDEAAAAAVQTTKKQPSKEQLMAIKAAIASAATLDEVERLERALMEADDGTAETTTMDVE